MICGELQEWDYGNYEGLTTSEIRARTAVGTYGRTAVPAASDPSRWARVLARVWREHGDVLAFAHVATGERARKRTVETRENLTAQEAHVASRARDGLSNSEIGARLFISPRTVEYHLHKVFTKLSISPRSELHRTLFREAATSMAG